MAGDEALEMESCRACRATGKVISNLGGTSSEVECPWCEGTGKFQSPEHDAQAKAPPAPEKPAESAEEPSESAEKPSESAEEPPESAEKASDGAEPKPEKAEPTPESPVDA